MLKSLCKHELAARLPSFFDYSLQVGNIVFPTVFNSDYIHIPHDMILPGSDHETLASIIYNNFSIPQDTTLDSFILKAILTPIDIDISEINDF